MQLLAYFDALPAGVRKLPGESQLPIAQTSSPRTLHTLSR